MRGDPFRWKAENLKGGRQGDARILCVSTGLRQVEPREAFPVSDGCELAAAIGMSHQPFQMCAPFPHGHLRGIEDHLDAHMSTTRAYLGIYCDLGVGHEAEWEVRS